MGFENSLRTITEKEIIKAWKIGLSLRSNGSPQKQELSDDDNGSAACSIITIEMPREVTNMPESNIWILRGRCKSRARIEATSRSYPRESYRSTHCHAE